MKRLKIFFKAIKFLVFFAIEISFILILYVFLKHEMILSTLVIFIVAYIIGEAFFASNHNKNAKELLSFFIEGE